MYTDVLHIQPPHHLPASVFQQRLDGEYNAFPPATHNASFRQRAQQPQQYTAHPVSSTVAIEPSVEYSSTCDGNAAEHMLRRKTPNGTLAAGYDARSTQMAARPRAAKHILMPLSDFAEPASHPAANRSWHLSVMTPSQNSSMKTLHEKQHPYREMGTHARQGTNQLIDRDQSNETVFEKRAQPYYGAGVDSVLHQGAALHQSHMYGNGHVVPTVLQPMWPPCLGFTSINHDGPYGPYWPDGAFEPYRPAPLREPRHGHQLPDDAASFHFTHAFMTARDRGWSQTGTPRPYSNSQDLSTGHRPDRRYMKPSPFQRPTNSSCDEQYPSEQYPSEWLQHGPFSRQEQTSNHGHDGGYVNESQDSGSTYVQSGYHKDVLRQSDHVQFKERVLIWAHRAYVTLIASIHQSRRTGSANHLQNERQFLSNLYPKPPSKPFLGAAAEHDPRLQIDRRNTEQSSNSNATKSNPIIHYSSIAQVSRNALADNPFSHQPHSLYLQRHHPRWQTRKQQSDFAQSGRSQQFGFANDIGDASAVTSQTESPPSMTAVSALEMLSRLCHESGWQWTDGMLLGGCLAYGLGDYMRATKWYTKLLTCDPNNVEALSNLAATCLSLNRRGEAERYWRQSVALRPNYFEAVEHLVGLFCEDRRGREAVKIIESVQQALRANSATVALISSEPSFDSSSEYSLSPETGFSERSDFEASDREALGEYGQGRKRAQCPRGVPSGYSIPPCDNGRMLALIHGKGNMLYALGDYAGAARAFEDAILIGSGQRRFGIRGLIRKVMRMFAGGMSAPIPVHQASSALDEPMLLMPEEAVETAKMVFPPFGQLPGLAEITRGAPEKAAMSIISNSLLSLAKIYQDGMSSNTATASGPRATSGVQDILALYYLSLSLQPSPSTANNVGILLASVQQATPTVRNSAMKSAVIPTVPGVAPGSGIALALAYYNYGLKLDSRHAHLYTNLGSLFKDIGQLDAAIKMYEKAVECDGKFDIALANLANAVKDRGKISDAISYYRKAVALNPDFAEAVCGLANALNSVCNWAGRGGVKFPGASKDRWHVDDHGMLYDAKYLQVSSSGWIGRVVTIVEKQLQEGENWGKGVLANVEGDQLRGQLDSGNISKSMSRQDVTLLSQALHTWSQQPWEGAKIVRLVERVTKRLAWLLYRNNYVERKVCRLANFSRPQLPSTLAIPSAPTVLPFHTFTCPLTAKQIRRISQRNGLRISCSTLRAPWLPSTIYEPPAPPKPHLNVGYVSSDFNNHPLAHLMQSVFGFHNRQRVKAFCYATTAGDGSTHRQQIEREAPVFKDTSSWSIDRLVKQIVSDGIHILINLNGYTRGARNEVFAARPAPVQMSFMGFAGTLGAEWCDYLLADKVAIPPSTLRPSRRNVDVIDQMKDGNNDDDQEDWMYGENIIFARDTFFCCDHRQSAPDAKGPPLSWHEEQNRRWEMRKELFPDIADDTVILGNFNQLYKIEPTTFRTWLRILSRLPKAILWLLRFPDLGESNLKETALRWVGSEVASRIIFTDVAPKSQHIARARVCDLFLDTPECNAHTTAADVLWSGTPLLTLPRYEYKMCSRMAASILTGALPKTGDGYGAARELIVRNDEEYEERAVELGASLMYPTARTGRVGFGHGRLVGLRKLLYESRDSSALFDTRRWVRDLEDGYDEAWHRWVEGKGGDIWL